MIKKINIDSNLQSILLENSFNDFTVLELRNAYVTLVNDSQLETGAARKFVYRHILRLEKKGLLDRKYSEKLSRTYYSKSELFSPERFNISKLFSQKGYTPKKDGNDTLEIKEKLISQLNQYKLELLTSIGETDEYKSLCNRFPLLTECLQVKYNLARDNGSKILGRIKALESTINQPLLSNLSDETS